jgi:hypothetical protein
MFCFKNKEGEEICIPIRLLVRQLIPWWWWQGSPGDPTPWKWVEHPKIDDKLQKEVATIALMSELTKTLSPDRAKAIKAVLQKAIQPERDLPKGTTFTL